MELRHLRYFVAVAEELHFTRAAERLHIGQPPLSQQIQALEAELGVSLLDRSSRRVALTEAGRHFLRRAQEILRETEQAAEQARRVARGETGELSVGFTSSLPFTSFLPQVVKNFRQHCPDVALTLREMTSLAQIHAVADGSLDIGLVRRPEGPLPEGAVLRDLLSHPLRVVIQADHPLAARPALAVADLRDEPFVMHPRAAGAGIYRQLQRLCREAGFEPRVVQEAREATTLIGLCAAGLGLTILPAPFECIRIEGVRYLPLTDAEAYATMTLVTRAGESPPLVVRFVAQVETLRAAA